MLKLVIMSLKKAGGSLAPENTDSVRPSMASSAFWSFVKPEHWQPGQIEIYIYIIIYIYIYIVFIMFITINAIVKFLARITG